MGATEATEITEVSVKNNIKKTDNSVSFEEALTATGIGSYNHALFVIAIYSLLAAVGEMFCVGFIVTSAQCDLDLDVYKKGIIGSVPMLGVVATAHFWGYLADTKGRKFALTVTMSGTFTFAILSSFANNWIFLAFTKMLSAACSSGTNAVVYALLGEQTPVAVRGKYLMYTATGVMLSQGVNAIIAYPILHLTFSYYIPFLNFSYRPWRLLAQAFGFLNGFNLFLLFWCVIESPKYYFAKGQNEEGLKIMRKIFSRNSGEPEEKYMIRHVVLEEKVVEEKKKNIIISMIDQTKPLFFRENIKNTALISYLCIVVYAAGPPFIIWMPTILDSYSRGLVGGQNFCQMIKKKTANSSDVSSNYTEITQVPICEDSVISDFTIVSMIAVAVYMTVATALSVILIRFTGKKWMFIFILLASSSLGFALNFVYNVGGLACFFGLMSSILAMGITTTYAVELFPTYLRAMGVCLTMMIGRAFSFIVINIVGPQLETNCDNFIFGLSAFVLSGALVALFLPGDKKTAVDTKEDVEQNKTSTNM